MSRTSTTDWASQAVGDLFDMQLGKMLSAATRSGPRQRPFLANRNVQWNRIDLNDVETMHFSPSEDQSFGLESGDLLVCEGGEIGRTAIWAGELADCHIQNAVHRLRPRDGAIVPRYFLHFMRYAADYGLFRRLSGQTSIAHLTKEGLGQLAVPLPPRLEQTGIAETFDTVDDMIRLTERLIGKLELTKQGILRDLLTRGIDENGNLRDPELQPDSFHDTPLGLLPRTWTVRRLGDLLADVEPPMRSGPFGSALLKEELVDQGIPILGIDNVHVENFVRDYSRFVTAAKFRELSRYAVRPNDIMITIMGTVGRCCEVPPGIGEALSSKHVWTLTIDQSVYVPSLVCLQVNYSEWVLRHFSKDTQGGIMSAIQAGTLRSVLLPTPPIHEQTEIASILMAQNSRLVALRDELSKLRLLKSGLMDDLLTGRVRVAAVEDAA